MRNCPPRTGGQSDFPGRRAPLMKAPCWTQRPIGMRCTPRIPPEAEPWSAPTPHTHPAGLEHLLHSPCAIDLHTLTASLIHTPCEIGLHNPTATPGDPSLLNRTRIPCTQHTNTNARISEPQLHLRTISQQSPKSGYESHVHFVLRPSTYGPPKF